VTGAPVKVFVAGTAEGMADVLAQLGSTPGVTLCGNERDARRAGPELARADADVVLLGTAAVQVPTEEMEAVRAATAAPIVLLLPAADPELLVAALAAGAVDALALPQPAGAVAFALMRARSLAPAPAAAAHTGANGTLVTVFSPRGGAGTTTVACNLAAVLARQHDRRTLLVDLDLQFGDAALSLGLEPETTVHDLVSARRDIDADALAGYVRVHESGAHVLPAPLRPEDAELITEERLAPLFAVAKAAYDVVVVDTASQFAGPLLATIDRTDHLLLVATPDVPSVKNVKLALQTLDLLGFAGSRRHIVLNRVGARGALKRGQVEDALEVKAAFELPDDRDAAGAQNRGVPLAIGQPRSPLVKALGQIAAALVQPREPHATGGRRRRRR
jgi:pilus assembly protein CpaE